jgi:two-component system phosphate regulon sensor histidine kinase PhoR
MAETVSIIEQANQQMIGLIENLHTVASGEQAEILFKKEKVDQVALLQKILKQFEPLMAQNKITYKYAAPKKLPAVICDQGKLAEVYSNLIENAIKYNKLNGSISVEHGIEGGFMLTEIKDTGVGIPAKNIKKVFMPYFRGDNNQARGSGLGLYIVKKMLERMGGKIEVSSRVGKGTQFVVFMPLAKK